MRNRSRIFSALLATIAIALPLWAAERLAVKTGLWENTLTLHITGVGMTAEDLAKMPAAERAQTEQMMKELGIGTPRTMTERSCLTAKDLDGNAFLDSLKDAGEDCNYRQVTATSKRQEWTFQCSTADGDATGRMVIDVLDDRHVRGSVQARMTEGSMDMQFDASWKAADCGSVKPEP